MSVGFKIKKLREERNLSQNKLAHQLYISQSELSKIENGQSKKIDFYFMMKVCAFFDKDFEFFTSNDKKEVSDLDENLIIDLNTKETDVFPERIIGEIKMIIDENKKKDKIIKWLLEENERFRKEYKKRDQ